MSRFPGKRVVAVAVVALAGCGGNVDVSRGGAGDSGTTSSATTTTATTTTTTSTTTGTTTSTTGTTTSTTTANCAWLEQQFAAALDAATKCNACMNSDRCLGGPQTEDTCGCPVGLVTFPGDLAAKAIAAHDAWVAAGCGPYECGKPCSAAQSWSCHPGGQGNCDGVCGPSI